jgi:hypothetical protein
MSTIRILEIAILANGVGGCGLAIASWCNSAVIGSLARRIKELEKKDANHPLR